MSEEFNPFDGKYNVSYADGTRRFNAQIENILSILSDFVNVTKQRDTTLREAFNHTTLQLHDVDERINNIAHEIARSEVASLRSELVDKGVLE